MAYCSKTFENLHFNSRAGVNMMLTVCALCSVLDTNHKSELCAVVH